jgi:hypothetical protein
MQRILGVLLFVVVFANGAEAQELTVGVTTYTPFGLNDLDGKLPGSAELRVTLPIAGKFALEPFVTAGTTHWAGGRRTEGFYGLQVRQQIVEMTNTSAFITYGAAGLYSSRGRYTGPPIGHIGFGVRQRVSKHVAFRPEVHLVTFHVVPIGVRFVAGVSVGR